MTKRRIETDDDLVAAIGDVFDHLPSPRTPEEIDSVLRDAGHDPEDAGRQLASFVDGIVRRERRVIAAKRKAEFNALSSRMKQMELPNTRLEIIESIQALAENRPEPMAAHFRNLEKQTLDDLRELLRELLALDSEGGG